MRRACGDSAAVAVVGPVPSDRLVVSLMKKRAISRGEEKETTTPAPLECSVLGLDIGLLEEEERDENFGKSITHGM